MAVFAVNQPITTTVPTVTVENKLVAGPHHFQLVVVNSAGVQSDPMTVTVVVSQGIVPLAAVKGKAPLQATKPATPPGAADPLAKTPPQGAAPTKEKPAKEKRPKSRGRK